MRLGKLVAGIKMLPFTVTKYFSVMNILDNILAPVGAKGVRCDGATLAMIRRLPSRSWSEVWSVSLQAKIFDL